MADGIGVYQGASATLNNTFLLDNPRAAVVVHQANERPDGSADVTLEGCTLKGGTHTAVFNGTEIPSSAAAANNKATTGEGGAVGDGYVAKGSLEVMGAYCPDGGAASSCTPSP